MKNKLDPQTVIDFKGGCEKAFKRVFEDYHLPIVIFTNKITNNDQEAEDITNDAFIKLFKLCGQFENEGKIRSFLYVVARNNGLNYLKAKKQKDTWYLPLPERLKDDILLTHEDIIEEEVVDKLYQEIELLPEQMQKIFKMLYLEMLKPAEVAVILNISRKTVYVQKKRAVDTLRKKLRPDL